MRIDKLKCINCAACIPYCPAGAIMQDSGGSDLSIDEDRCFECGVCMRSIPCPAGAFVPSPDSYHRRIKGFFSNPYLKHEMTMVPGRGTEEVKTNDVTGRIKPGETGLCIEFGRPVPGCSFYEISQVAGFLIGERVQFEANNPLTFLMDPKTGRFPQELMHVRILSAILELRCDAADVHHLVKRIQRICEKKNVAVSVGIILRFDQKSLHRIETLSKDLGLRIMNAKGNFGLGRPIIS